jgi:uncharacterized protein YciI
MGYFAVIREAGTSWMPGGIIGQQGLDDHAAFMGQLADEGFAIAAGPLAGSEQDRLRALVIVTAEDEGQIHSRLAEDPWTRSRQLRITSIEAWKLFVGGERLG